MLNKYRFVYIRPHIQVSNYYTTSQQRVVLGDGDVYPIPTPQEGGGGGKERFSLFWVTPYKLPHPTHTTQSTTLYLCYTTSMELKWGHYKRIDSSFHTSTLCDGILHVKIMTSPTEEDRFSNLQEKAIEAFMSGGVNGCNCKR